MLPAVIDPKRVKVGLAGAGEALERRRVMLAEAGIAPRCIDADAALDGLHILYVAGASESVSEALAARARTAGILVNVEDRPALCDFHVPAQLHRGDLLLTVSSAGRAPGLVRFIRDWLAERFGTEWSARLDEAAGRREAWRAEGLPMATVSRQTRELARDWLS